VNEGVCQHRDQRVLMAKTMDQMVCFFAY
jgi:hypothetical protein